MNTKRNFQTIDVLYFLCFGVVLAMSIWKVRFGFPGADESIYISIPYRVLQGDAFLLQEWHMSQMSGFLVLPLLRIYLAITKSTEGIYLAFRYLYTVLHTCTALYLYFRLRERNRAGAAAASVYYELSTYGSLMALSYNTMGIGLMTLACVTMASSHGKTWEYLFSGLCFAGAVLCCPYLLLVYAAYCLAVLFFRLRKKSCDLAGVFSVGGWLRFTLSCVLLALLFFWRCSLFSAGNIQKLIESLPMIVVDDEHPSRSLFECIRGFYHSFYKYNGYFKPVLYGSLLLSAVILLDKKRTVRRPLYLVCALGLTMLFASPYLIMYRTPNYIVFPLCIIGFFAYLLCEKKDHRMMALVYIPAAIYWFCIDLSSNMEFSTISGISVVNTPACFLFIAQLLREMWGTDRDKRSFARTAARVSSGLCALCCAVLIATLFVSRVEFNYSAPAPWKSPALCTQGAVKGIRTTEERLDLYTREYNALAPLREKTDGNVMYFYCESYRYLEDPKRCGSFSMWFYPRDPEASVSKLARYWELNPDKFADYIYLNEEILEDDRILPALRSRWNFTEWPLDVGEVLIMERPQLP